MASHSKAEAILWLQQMQEKLLAEGIRRYPKRSDFTAEQVVAIKAHLGPWPRALEAAALKPSCNTEPASQSNEKRIVKNK